MRGSGLSLRKRDPGRQRRVRVPCPFQDTRNAQANASGTRSKGKAARAEVSGNKGELKAGWEPAPGTRPGCHRTVTGPSPGGAGCCHIALAEEGQTQFGGKGFSGSSILRDGAGFHTLPVPTASGMELEPLILPVSTSLRMGGWGWGPASRLSPGSFGMEMELLIPSPAQFSQPSLCQGGVRSSGKFSALPPSLTQIQVPVGSPPWSSPQTSSAGFQLSRSPNWPGQPVTGVVTDRHSERRQTR